MSWRLFRRRTPESELTQIIERIDPEDYILEIHSGCGTLKLDMYKNNKQLYYEITIEIEYDEYLCVETKERIRIQGYINGDRILNTTPKNVNECVRTIRRLMNGGKDD